MNSLSAIEREIIQKFRQEVGENSGEDGEFSIFKVLANMSLQEFKNQELKNKSLESKLEKYKKINDKLWREKKDWEEERVNLKREMCKLEARVKRLGSDCSSSYELIDKLKAEIIGLRQDLNVQYAEYREANERIRYLQDLVYPPGWNISHRCDEEGRNPDIAVDEETPALFTETNMNRQVNGRTYEASKFSYG